MKKSKVKICKYPKCKKEVHSDRALFCLEHSRDLKDKRNKVGAAAGGLALFGLSVLAKNLGSKKS